MMLHAGFFLNLPKGRLNSFHFLQRLWYDAPL